MISNVCCIIRTTLCSKEDVSYHAIGSWSFFSVRPHHRTDPEILYHERWTIEDTCTIRQDDIIETVPTRLETAYLELSPSATCSNIFEDGLTLSTPMYRRNLDIYRIMCTYVSDPLARCKL